MVLPPKDYGRILTILAIWELSRIKPITMETLLVQRPETTSTTDQFRIYLGRDCLLALVQAVTIQDQTSVLVGQLQKLI